LGFFEIFSKNPFGVFWRLSFSVARKLLANFITKRIGCLAYPFLTVQFLLKKSLGIPLWERN
jgi:hypothetical protein